MTTEPPDNIIDLAAPYGRKKDGTPKKPTGFAKGGANYKPPSGIPAGGFIASPPRPGSGPEALIPGSGPEKRALGEASRLNREIAAEEAMQVMYGIMHDPAAGHATQLQASEKLLNRIEGAPTARIAGPREGDDEGPIRIELDFGVIAYAPDANT